MQYRSGIFTSAASPVAVTLPLGFVPDKFQVTNFNASATGTGIGSAVWFRNASADASALITTLTAGAPVQTQIVSNGFTPVNAGGLWATTTYSGISAISKANPAVVTMASTAGLANGNTITLSNVAGMTQLNTNRYVISGLTGTTFNLYDLYGNPVNSTAFGTYVANANSPAQINVISTPATAPVLNPTNGQVITPGSPVGLQLDTGFAGITIGTGVQVASNNVFWEAFFATPTGW